MALGIPSYLSYYGETFLALAALVFAPDIPNERGRLWDLREQGMLSLLLFTKNTSIFEF